MSKCKKLLAKEANLLEDLIEILKDQIYKLEK
jgi:hypothetical protein